MHLSLVCTLYICTIVHRLPNFVCLYVFNSCLAGTVYIEPPLLFLQPPIVWRERPPVSDGVVCSAPAPSVTEPAMALLLLCVCLVPGSGRAADLWRRIPDVFELVLNLPDETEPSRFVPQ